MSKEKLNPTLLIGGLVVGGLAYYFITLKDKNNPFDFKWTQAELKAVQGDYGKTQNGVQLHHFKDFIAEQEKIVHHGYDKPAAAVITGKSSAKPPLPIWKEMLYKKHPWAKYIK